MSKLLFLLTLIMMTFVACESPEYASDQYVSKEQADKLVTQIVHYTAKMPSGATHETKFDKEFDAYYEDVSHDYDIRSYFVDADSMHYLLMTRAAKSITPMREAIGIKLKPGKVDTFAWYEEVFRTWKMKDEILQERYPVLFDRMVKGQSLESYYSKSKGDQYIEFPDGRFYFDTQQRKWRDQVLEARGL
jgi:hypothetical protein